MATPKLYRCSVVPTTTVTYPAYWLTLEGTGLDREAVSAGISRYSARLAVDLDPQTDNGILIDGPISFKQLTGLIRQHVAGAGGCIRVTQEFYGEELLDGISLWHLIDAKYVLNTSLNKTELTNLATVLFQHTLVGLPAGENEPEGRLYVHTEPGRAPGDVATAVKQALELFLSRPK